MTRISTCMYVRMYVSSMGPYGLCSFAVICIEFAQKGFHQRPIDFYAFHMDFTVFNCLWSSSSSSTAYTLLYMCNCHLFNTSMELGVWLHLLSVFSTRATKLLCLICFYCRFKINASKHNEKNNNSKLEWNCINAKDISDKSSLLWAIYWDFITLARSHSHSSLSFFLFFISYSDKINCTVTQIHHKKFALLVMRVESIDMVLPVRTFFFG